MGKNISEMERCGKWQAKLNMYDVRPLVTAGCVASDSFLNEVVVQHNNAAKIAFSERVTVAGEVIEYHYRPLVHLDLCERKQLVKA